jgi:hypothetical protein
MTFLNQKIINNNCDFIFKHSNNILINGIRRFLLSNTIFPIYIFDVVDVETNNIHKFSLYKLKHLFRYIYINMEKNKNENIENSNFSLKINNKNKNETIICLSDKIITSKSILFRKDLLLFSVGCNEFVTVKGKIIKSTGNICGKFKNVWNMNGDGSNNIMFNCSMTMIERYSPHTVIFMCFNRMEKIINNFIKIIGDEKKYIKKKNLEYNILINDIESFDTTIQSIIEKYSSDVLKHEYFLNFIINKTSIYESNIILKIYTKKSIKNLKSELEEVGKKILFDIDLMKKSADKTFSKKIITNY